MNDPLLRKLDEQWRTLEQRQTLALLTVDLPTATADGPVLVANDDRGRHLLVPLGIRGAKAIKPDYRSRGVQLAPRPVGKPGSIRWYADLACVDDRLTTAFSALCTDVILRVERRPQDAAAIVQRVLSEWRELLRAGDGALGSNEIAGLFAELLVLEHLLDSGMTGVEAWTGPEGRRHDFRQGSEAIEVKSTIAGDASEVRVHGLDQLEAPDNGTLALGFFRLEGVADGDTSLYTLVDRVQAKVVDQSTFATRLRKAGYRDQHADRYRTACFVLREELWYDVGPGFPRLVAGALPGGAPPPGVTFIDYTVDLGVAAAHRLDRDRAYERFVG